MVEVEGSPKKTRGRAISLSLSRSDSPIFVLSLSPSLFLCLCLSLPEGMGDGLDPPATWAPHLLWGGENVFTGSRHCSHVFDATLAIYTHTDIFRQIQIQRNTCIQRFNPWNAPVRVCKTHVECTKQS